MTRAALIFMCAAALAACASDEPDTAGPMQPGPMDDSGITPVLDAGSLEDHITVPVDPRDAAITEPTPILDLPLVIARPSQPLSTSTIDVLLLQPTGERPTAAPVEGVAVSTGGPAVLTNRFGLAEVTTVYGADFADVYAFSAGYTLAHARVAIRPGEASQVVLMAAPIETFRLDDTHAGGTVEATELSATFQADAFALPWGGTAKGPAVVSATLLSEPTEAGCAPGGMRARVDGQLVPIAGVLAFELRVAQGTTELELAQDATVVIASPPTALNGLDPAAVTLYAFDGEAGAYVPAGALDLTSDPNTVHATIDRLGHWLVGSHTAPAHCVRIDALGQSGPLPHADVLIKGTSGFSAARVETDALGSACAPFPLGGDLDAHALGKVGAQLASAEGTIAASLEPAACDESCAGSTLQLNPIALGCVTGTLSAPWLAPYGTTAVIMESAFSYSASLPSDGPFCIDLRAGSTVMLGDPNLACSSGSTLVEAAQALPGASCVEPSGCTDLGTITCCAMQEVCNATPAADDDCDGQVDEGCACGGSTCVTTSGEGCCDGAACGVRSTFTDECVSAEPFGIPIGCPSFQVPSVEGGTTTATGCCRMNNECGLMWDPIGCVSAADAPRVWGQAVTPLSTPCTP